MLSSLPKDMESELVEKFSDSVKFLVPLNSLSYWKIGGLAQCVLSPRSLNELQEAIRLCHSYPTIPKLVIGDCSNLLFDDSGFDGVLIKLGNELSNIAIKGTRVYCEAGAWVPEVAYRCYRSGLSGIEHICGIPGRIGGLVYMNGGSQRRGILENVEEVIAFDADGEKLEFHSGNLHHSYRQSPFQNKPITIASVTLSLVKSDVSTVRHAMKNILASRRKKFPRKLPNCGSVFLSNPKMYDVVGPPGFAIEQAGLKGLREGNAQISPLHANFIVNLGGAKSRDVLFLIARARNDVFKRTGFKMDCEVRYVTKDGDIMQAHEYTDKAI